MDEALSGTMSGAAQGAAAGSVFGPWGTVAGGVVGGALGLMSGLSASEASRRRRRIIDEQARRMRLEHDRTTSLATANGAASGIEFDSQSLQTALTTMTNEFRSQEDLFKKTGMQAIEDTRNAGMWNAFGDVAGSIFAAAKPRK